MTSVEADLLHQLGGGRSYDCHNQPTRKVQPKLPCPNCAPGIVGDPCPCPDSADGQGRSSTAAVAVTRRRRRGARCNPQGHRRELSILRCGRLTHKTTTSSSPYLCRPAPGKATAAQSSPSGAASLTSSSYASWCDTALRLWSKTESRVHPLPRDHVSVVRKNVRENPSTVSPTSARASFRQRENHRARSSQWPRADVACLCA